MFETQKYTKKPFEVTAVRVTEENLYEVAQWCTGEIAQAPARGKFIKVRVIHAVNERQTQAFPGDWVLYAGTSYRVYTDKAFNKGFEPSAGKSDKLPEGYPVGDRGNLQPAFVSMAGEEV